MKNNVSINLGRLKSLGINELYQVPLYLPKNYIDLRNPLKTLNEIFQHQDGKVLVVGQVLKPARIKHSRTTQAFIEVTLQDGNTISFSVFGNHTQIKETAQQIFERKWVAVQGQPIVNGKFYNLYNTKIFDLNLVGKIIPVYTGKKGVITPETTFKEIQSKLDKAIPLTADYLRKATDPKVLNKLIDPNKIEIMLYSAHRPQKIKHAQKAIYILECLAASIAKNKIKEHFSFQNHNQTPRIDATRWHEYAKGIEFELTTEQVEAITGMAKELNQSTPSRLMLQGDVGTGKTAVYGTLAMTAAMMGYKVGIMLPTTTLTKQVYEEINSWLPADHDEKMSLHLVLGESNTPILNEKNNKGMLIMGTSALLFRDLGSFDLIIVDEQHKFSRSQREQLLFGKAHLIEVSATPIPRTVALIRYGAMKAWRLTKNHTQKTIHSHLLIGRKEGMKIPQAVAETINKGQQAIIVYALKQESMAERMAGMKSAEEAYSWWEKRYPGRVRLVHSEMDDEQKEMAINDMKAHKADILISTTVIEVGVTIPNVMLLAVINAERFGMVSLWQLRGRIARRGGVGNFYMLVPKETQSDKTIERLSALLECKDGFEVAERDLELRGAGDLSINSDAQSGDDNSILVGRKVNLEILDKIA